jgi:hypothetical protein
MITTTGNSTTIPATRPGLYWVYRDGIRVKKGWHQLSDGERAAQIAAEGRAFFIDQFLECA